MNEQIENKDFLPILSIFSLSYCIFMLSIPFIVFEIMLKLYVSLPVPFFELTMLFPFLCAIIMSPILSYFVLKRHYDRKQFKATDAIISFVLLGLLIALTIKSNTLGW